MAYMFATPRGAWPPPGGRQPLIQGVGATPTLGGLQIRAMYVARRVRARRVLACIVDGQTELALAAWVEWPKEYRRGPDMFEGVFLPYDRQTRHRVRRDFWL